MISAVLLHSIVIVGEIEEIFLISLVSIKSSIFDAHVGKLTICVRACF